MYTIHHLLNHKFPYLSPHMLMMDVTTVFVKLKSICFLINRQMLFNSYGIFIMLQFARMLKVQSLLNF